MSTKTILPSSLTEAIDLYLDKRGLAALRKTVKNRIRRLVKEKHYYKIEKEVIDMFRKSKKKVIHTLGKAVYQQNCQK